MRFGQRYFDKSCSSSKDGTDFVIMEPAPFARKSYSHNSNGPALRYELVFRIQRTDIVWVNGLFPADDFSDLRIFREELKTPLRDDDLIVADRGYSDEKDLLLADICSRQHQLHKRMRSRHEAINGKIKTFGVLS